MAWSSRRCNPALWALLLLCACDESSDPSAPDAGDMRDAAAEVDAGGAADASADAEQDARAPADAGVVEVPCEVTPPTSCPEPPVYYEDITSILEERCQTCHDGKGVEWPLTTYGHVASWAMEIRAAMVGCDMPPKDSGLSMPAEEREQILTWLLCKMPQRGDAGAGGH